MSTRRHSNRQQQRKLYMFVNKSIFSLESIFRLSYHITVCPIFYLYLSNVTFTFESMETYQTWNSCGIVNGVNKQCVKEWQREQLKHKVCTFHQCRQSPSSKFTGENGLNPFKRSFFISVNSCSLNSFFIVCVHLFFGGGLICLFSCLFLFFGCWRWKFVLTCAYHNAHVVSHILCIYAFKKNDLLHKWDASIGRFSIPIKSGSE